MFLRYVKVESDSKHRDKDIGDILCNIDSNILILFIVNRPAWALCMTFQRRLKLDQNISYVVAERLDAPSGIMLSREHANTRRHAEN